MHITRTIYSTNEAREFLAQCDKDFDQRVDQAVSLILEKQHRFLCLSGPSCAGKTTTANKITQKLAQKGVATHVISIDDFFFNCEN